MRNPGIEDEIETICNILESTFERWKSFNKVMHDEYLKTCFKLTLELGILIGKNQRFIFSDEENENIKRKKRNKL